MLKVEINYKNHLFLDATSTRREESKPAEPKRKPLILQSSPLRSAFIDKDADKALQVKER